MRLIGLLVAVLAGAAVGTGLLRRYALASRVLDIPNERSSHRVPTPRGGGVAIVIAFLAAVVLLAAARALPVRIASALVGAGALVAVVGFVDDHRPLPARWRLLAHFAAAAWALLWLGGLPFVSIFGRLLHPGPIGNILAAIGLVWLLNLYNFMDGIDGIAGVEAVSVGLGAAALYGLGAAPRAETALPLLLAAAASGFLFWNFPPAKIFMGDAGSGFLGLMFGVLAVRAASLSPTWLWSWIILLGAFTVDATVTLLRRMQRRERLSEAHRSHAYQHAAVRRGSHRSVTIAVGGINLLWLLPWAVAVGLGRVPPLVGLIIAYAPLVWLALRLGAGIPARVARAP